MTGTQADLNEAQPNVWVAHVRDGIQAVGVHTGRTICKLHLASPGLHVDLNGDGVLDHLQATGLQSPTALLELVQAWFAFACGAVANPLVCVWTLQSLNVHCVAFNNKL